MINEIIKRDGRKVPFKIKKVATAIFKAAVEVGGNDYTIAENLANKIYEFLELNYSKNIPTVEQIQDATEKILIEEGHAATAKSYILYRAERTRLREMNSEIMKTFAELTFLDSKDNDIKRENANVNADTAMGTMLKYGSEGAKKFNHSFVLNKNHSKAHIEGDIHIHDLDFLTLTTTCTQIDLVKLFKDGFSTGEGHLREPNDVVSYAALAAIAIQSNQNDQHGGQSIPNFEYAIAIGVKKTYRKLHIKNLIKAVELLTEKCDAEAYVINLLEEIKITNQLIPSLDDTNNYLKQEKSKLLEEFDELTVNKIQVFVNKYTIKEVEKTTYQAMEAFIHNLNTMHSRAGAQVPFSSINYGLDTTPEGRLVMKNLLLATEAGLGSGETPIFPIQIFKIKDGINYNEGEPNYDLFKLACRVSAKRLFPNFSFMDAPFNLKYYKKGDYNTEVAYMGCRTRVMANVYDKTNEVACGRGNLSFTLINLPRIAILSNKNLDVFFKSLDKQINLVIEQLMDRYKIQAKKKVLNYPFLMGQGIWLGSDNLKRDDEVGEILKHGTLSVGFIGLAETLKSLIGSHHGENQEARELGLKIIGHMRDRMDEECKKTGFNYTLLATPAEGLSGRFVKLDRKRFGKIEGVTDRDYYTNSFHIPVYYKISAFDKIKFEAPYHELTNAGHISYVELDGDPTKNLEAFEQIVRCMKESGIGYGSINHPVDRDPLCGYTGVIKDICPSCGRKEFENELGGFERIRRITGYLVGTVDRFNNAKKAEEKDRVKHSV